MECDQKCFEFNHPINSSSLNQNKTISFNFLEDLTIHGFVGYFHSVLYDKVTLSTRPIDHTDGMMSWFPMFFPIKVT
jgi:protein arginine N-methyltransferase 5